MPRYGLGLASALHHPVIQPRRRPSGSSNSGTQELSKAQLLTNSLVRGGDEGGGRSDEEGKEEEGTHLGKYIREGMVMVILKQDLCTCKDDEWRGSTVAIEYYSYVDFHWRSLLQVR